jgi:hypothetical protein
MEEYEGWNLDADTANADWLKGKKKKKQPKESAAPKSDVLQKLIETTKRKDASH